MIHSLYTEREIFLRELVSNASDACDKLRFQALTQPELLRGDEVLQVEVRGDAEQRTLVVQDNGIGMTEAEAIAHLGTIAKSGTKDFLRSLGQDQAKNANLIGQFGVGFYSALMVADRVVVESRAAAATSDHGVRWETVGDGTYATEAITRAQRGTTITLHLKEDAKEFTEGWRLRELIKKYSDYVAYPVRMPKVLSEEEQKKGATAELEQVNAGQALWTRPKDGITDAQYLEFYHAACRQFDEPATRVHFTVEGTLSFTALLFIPGQKPYDLFDRDRRGLALYVRRVFVMDRCEDLLPEYLRFVKGVVDSDDLPLNVSREMLQQQEVVGKLRKQLVKRLLDHLLKLGSSSEEADKKAFASVDGAFGTVLREGLATDFENRDKISRLVRWRSTKSGQEGVGEVTGLEEYVRRMPAGQNAIYYLTAPSLEAARSSPQLEGFAKKGYEVLLLVDQVDEWVVGQLSEFDKRPLRSVAKGAADLGSADDKKALDEQQKALGGFMTFVKESLGEGISEVRLSDRLTDSPCCLVSDEHAMSPQMEELMRRAGREVPKQKRTLELNPGHPLVAGLRAAQEAGGADPERLRRQVRLLRDQALLAEGGRVEDPASFAKGIQELMLAALAPGGR
jgi:molecular chaperone HtpG